MDAVKIFLENVHCNLTVAPSKIPKEALRQLIILSTIMTRLRHINGDLCVTNYRVSMGSCLWPTFADFYMCHLANKVFNEHPSLKPAICKRYVDNTLAATQDLQLLEIIKKTNSREILCSTSRMKKKNLEV